MRIHVRQVEEVRGGDHVEEESGGGAGMAVGDNVGCQGEYFG
jgi:hypothetical protein